MSATNSRAAASREFFKLKEDERTDSQSKGELRFFKQVKKDTKWGDGESFNQLSGKVIDVHVKEYEYQGEKKKSLIIVLEDVPSMEFALGLRSFTAQGILNTLAGGNGFDLVFSCGKINEKGYPTLWINKPSATKEGSRTNWKYQPSELPKVTTTTDEEGNKIKKGQKAADEFWLKVVEGIQASLQSGESTPTTTTEEKASYGKGKKTPTSGQGKSGNAMLDEGVPQGEPTDDLPF